jgi:branched-chain amino acid transport system permease protein
MSVGTLAAQSSNILTGKTIRVALLGSAVAVFLCLVGIVPTFHARPLILDVISLGQTALVLAFLGTGWVAAGTSGRGGVPAVAAAGVVGLVTGLGVTVLVLVGSVVDLRAVFLPASPEMYNILTFGLGLVGAWIPPVVGLIVGAAAGAVRLAPIAVRRPVLTAVAALLMAGLFSGILRNAMLTTPLEDLARLLFTSQGLTIVGAIVTVVLVVGIREAFLYTRVRSRVAAMPPAERRLVTWPAIVVLALVVIVLPQALGQFVAHVIAIVAIYILLGLGLNITLGLAGLLDLGFVAFLAVGAYTVGLLTSTAEFGIAQWPFWAAIPFAVIVAMLFGAFLGLPILGVRGDYLAIATLGFGEIIRILSGSDLLKTWLGGPQGIINIPKPIAVPPDNLLAGPNQIYYIALACAGVVAFVAWRLRRSRTGRAWLSIREDEDVAEAVGVNLVQTKLLAYMLGAAFAGLGGGIFAALVGSIFDSSISVNVSINVVAIVVIGGMGSIPGAVLGAIFLIGVPELFREFADYRFLFYGAALILMMLYRPEGLLPTRFAARELHAEESGVAATALSGGSE